MTAKATYELDAEPRAAQGKGASRRLRRLSDKVPAILYGGKEKPDCIALDQKKVMHAMENPSFFSRILTLNFPGKKQQVVLKAVQRHHFKKSLLHMDFLRVNPTDVIQMKVPIRFMGGEVAPGVVDEAGIVNHRMNELDIRCQVQHLPEYIEIDISKMVLDQTLHISDLTLPKNVESVALSHGKEHDHAVVSIHLPKVIVEETPAPVETTEESTEATAESAAKETKEASAKDKSKEAGTKDKGK